MHTHQDTIGAGLNLVQVLQNLHLIHATRTLPKEVVKKIMKNTNLQEAFQVLKPSKANLQCVTQNITPTSPKT